MPRIRSLKPEHRTHRRVGKFTDFEYRLWASMILEADDEGRLVCDADQLRAQTWPYHPKVTIAKVEAAVQAIAEARRIVLYDVADVHYAAFPKWKHHQHPKYPTPTKLPAPPGAFPKSSPNAPPTLGEDSPRSREGLSREELRGVELRGGESRGEDAPPSAAPDQTHSLNGTGSTRKKTSESPAEWFNACGEGRRRQCVKTEYLGHADLPVQCYTHEALSGRRRRLPWSVPAPTVSAPQTTLRHPTRQEKTPRKVCDLPRGPDLPRRFEVREAHRVPRRFQSP